MSDSISRQAVKEWLAKWEGYLDADMIARMQYRVIDIPNAKPEQQWIPCSERLPDTNRDVLLQFGNSMGVGFWEHNSWGINTGDDIYSEIGEREAQPIAWRELPEPWEGGEDETD